MTNFILISGHHCYVKSDHLGVIIDPTEGFNLKCGWGKSKKDAINNFISRNGLNIAKEVIEC